MRGDKFLDGLGWLGVVLFVLISAGGLAFGVWSRWDGCDRDADALAAWLVFLARNDLRSRGEVRDIGIIVAAHQRRGEPWMERYFAEFSATTKHSATGYEVVLKPRIFCICAPARAYPITVQPLRQRAR